MPQTKPEHYTILRCEQSPVMRDNGQFFIGHCFFEQDKYYRYVIDSGPYPTREQAERVIVEKTREGPAIQVVDAIAATS